MTGKSQTEGLVMKETFAFTFLMAGLTGAIVSAIALMALGQFLAGSPLAALNATAHWLFGPDAISQSGFSFRVTGVGILTHILACLFWGAVFTALLLVMRVNETFLVWLYGLLVSMVALIIDYGLLPEQLSPGWHLVLPIKAVLAGFIALGVGLALGVTLARSRA